MVTERIKFDNLQKISETHSLNDKYENCLTTYTSSSWVHTNQRTKCKVLWESIGIREKNKITGKKYPYLIKDSQQIPMHRNLQIHKKRTTKIHSRSDQ